MNLYNQLPGAADCHNADSKSPDCKYFNETNLHTHGLWISPSGNSDNVMLVVKPGVSFQHEYNVPEDHPAGTFWYHPHRHYSTSIQVASGMAGALIVKGSRLPRLDAGSKDRKYIHGDLDTLLEPFEPVPPVPRGDRRPDYPEVVLLQQIPYACFLKEQELQKNSEGEWSCDKDKGELGVVESFSEQIGFNANQLKSNWEISGRYTTLNGEVQPEVPLRSNRLHRFRIILAGVSESISLRIRKLKEGAPPAWPKKMSGEQEEKYIEENCTGEVVDQWEVAADGLTREKILRKRINQLQPGYRSDVLVAFPGPGRYCVFDDWAASTISTQQEKARLLALAVVEGEKIKDGDVKAFITRELLRAADRLKVASPVREKIKSDLRAELGTALFTPHRNLTAEDLTNKARFQTAEFNLDDFSINKKPYAHDEVMYRLPLGATEEWRLSSLKGNHPFHIHVNPFQIKSIKRDGVEVLDTENEDEKSQYFGMKNAWKDTLFVEQGTEITVYTRYKRYIGDFVMHCHILDHEDMGMMQNVRVELPDGKGGTVQAGHHH
jgi:FtsP/CotA-like multicopper oxidase with cupredoxin domain